MSVCRNCKSNLMVKIMPLGCPKGDIGGFLWQCPTCKTIEADWTPMEESEILCYTCVREDCHSTNKNYKLCSAYIKGDEVEKVKE